MVGLPASAIARNGTDGRAPNAGALAAIMSTYCNMGGSSHPAWYAYQKGGIGTHPAAGSRHSTVERAPRGGDWAKAAKRNALLSLLAKPRVKRGRNRRSRVLDDVQRRRRAKGRLSYGKTKRRLRAPQADRKYESEQKGGIGAGPPTDSAWSYQKTTQNELPEQKWRRTRRRVHRKSKRAATSFRLHERGRRHTSRLF